MALNFEDDMVFENHVLWLGHIVMDNWYMFVDDVEYSGAGYDMEDAGKEFCEVLESTYGITVELVDILKKMESVL